MTDTNPKQLKKELTEVQCPECGKISLRGDWEYIKLKNVKNIGWYFGIKCPKCGAICDSDSGLDDKLDDPRHGQAKHINRGR